MTVAIVAALFFGGNFSRSRLMLKSHKYMQNMLSESRLNRRMHEIDISIWQIIFSTIARSFSENEKNYEYLGDSMPVEVRMNIKSEKEILLLVFPGYLSDITALKIMDIHPRRLFGRDRKY